MPRQGGGPPVRGPRLSRLHSERTASLDIRDAVRSAGMPPTLRRWALLVREVQRGERTEEEALEPHERLTELKMRLLGDRVSRRTAWRIARDNGWDDLCDAEYLAIARLQADALVTVDPELAAKAARVTRVASIEELTRAGQQAKNVGATTAYQK